MALEDICLWPDGVCCWREDLEDMLLHRSNDFEVIPFGTPEWDEFNKED
jgi:hypothetical protein